MSAFAGSKPALDALEVDQGPSRWLDSLERLRGDLDARPLRRRALDLGGRPLGAGRLLDLAAARRWPRPLERPTGPLAFAGEHTAGEHAALMEGAIRSGQRAARARLAR